MHKKIETTNAPAAIGPYSQAVCAGNMLYVSGQIPLDPGSGELIGENTAGQTRQVLENLRAVIEAAGFALTEVVKTTCYLKNMGDFADMNAVYTEFFGSVLPARAAVEVARLPKDVRIEIDAIAVKV